MDRWKRSLVLADESATERAGILLGGLVQPGDVLALIGDLGAGKTRFTRSLAQGMGVERLSAVCSPTFTIINEYSGPLPLYHIDLYRIGEEDEAWDLGLEEYFFGRGVCAVEWFDRFPRLWPQHTVEIRLDFLDNAPEGRRLTVCAQAPRAVALAESWTASLASKSA